MKKFVAGILAGMLAFGSLGGVQAATRSEIAAIQVSKSGNFKYWNKDAASITALKNYVKDVTNKKSRNFIPVEDRIAVFDWDGTLAGETSPCYFEWMMYLERALRDETYTPSKEDKSFAQTVEAAIREDFKNYAPTLSFLGSDFGTNEAISQESVFSGMTPEEYETYVKNFMETPAEGLTNLKRGEIFYLPMVEVIKFLQANDFDVFVVSGTDREVLRILTSDLLKIPSDKFIGTDVKYLSANQGGKDGLNYTYKSGDYLVRGKFVYKDLQMNKVDMIAREIGKQPVLAFGNSGSDASMLNYAINDNKYKSLAFMVLCDDIERELGNIPKAAKCVKLAQDNGWLSISMRDDFKTIYGDSVKRNVP